MITDDFGRFRGACRDLGRAIWAGRWSLGIYLFLVWLAVVAAVVIRTWS